MKRNLVLSLALTFCLAITLCCFAAVAPVSAKADNSEPITVVRGVEYEVSYLVKKAGLEYSSEATVTIGGVKVVKPSDEEDGTKASEQSAAGFRTADGKNVEFLSAKNYNVAVTKDDAVSSFVVSASNLPAENSLVYSYDEEALNTYKQNVQAATKIDDDSSDSEEDHKRDIRVDDDYTVPSLESLVKCDYFAYSQLRATLYYSLPQSTSYTSKSISDLTTSVKFTVSSVGVYSYYVLFSDGINNDMSTEDLVIGNGGWYNKDENGDPTGEIIVPIFYFTVQTSSSPKITVSSSEKAYQGLEYTVDCFNIVASDYSTSYTLYYFDPANGTAPAQSSFKQFDKEYLEGLNLVEVTKENGFEDANLFKSSTRKFTPVKKGYYYVVLRVVDFANEEDVTISRVIDANRELKQVKLEKEFLKYNWFTIVCFSVAVVCFVAVLLLIFIKPKDKSAKLTTKTE